MLVALHSWLMTPMIGGAGVVLLQFSRFLVMISLLFLAYGVGMWLEQVRLNPDSMRPRFVRVAYLLVGTVLVVVAVVGASLYFVMGVMSPPPMVAVRWFMLANFAVAIPILCLVLMVRLRSAYMAARSKLAGRQKFPPRHPN